MEVYDRADKVNFMNIGTKQEPIFRRMKGFTTSGKELNPKTRTRQYVDEKIERESTTGYSPNIPYGFDRIVDDPVHEKIVKVHDEELTGEEVEILNVDMRTKEATLRTYNVNPDTEGDDEEAYTYSGGFHAAGEIEKGTATVSADEMTATFTPTASL